MTDYTQYIQYPILIPIAIVYFVFKNIETLKLILPNVNRDLERLILHRDSSKKESKALYKFLNSEIKKKSFKNATGLYYNKRNLKIIKLYSTVSNKMSWNEFKEIESLIEDVDSLREISSKKVKKQIFISGFIFLGSIILLFYSISLSINKDFLGKINTNLVPAMFCFGGEIIFITYVHRINGVRKYNKIVKAKKPA